MNILEVGQSYTANRAKSGSSSRGDWEFVSVVNERGKEEVTIWVDNTPSGVTEGGKFKIVEVTKFGVTNRKDKDGNWRQEPSFTCKILAEKFEDFDTMCDNPFDEVEGELPY